MGQPILPEIREQGSVMVMIDCDPANGGMSINSDFIVNFGNEQTVLAAAMKPVILVAIVQVIFGYDDTYGKNRKSR